MINAIAKMEQIEGNWDATSPFEVKEDMTPTGASASTKKCCLRCLGEHSTNSCTVFSGKLPGGTCFTCKKGRHWTGSCKK